MTPARRRAVSLAEATERSAARRCAAPRPRILARRTVPKRDLRAHPLHVRPPRLPARADPREQSSQLRRSPRRRHHWRRQRTGGQRPVARAAPSQEIARHRPCVGSEGWRRMSSTWPNHRRRPRSRDQVRGAARPCRSFCQPRRALCGLQARAHRLARGGWPARLRARSTRGGSPRAPPLPRSTAVPTVRAPHLPPSPHRRS